MADTRPTTCRFRLEDEGKSYPRSSCTACGKSVFKGLGTHCEYGVKTSEEEEVAPEEKNKYGGKDLYGELAIKLNISRDEAKGRVLAAAYGLIKSPLDLVAQFHDKFMLPGLEQTETRDLNDEEALFRIKFMLEELREYAEASGYDTVANDMELLSQRMSGDPLYKDRDTLTISRHGQLDALVDLSYVLQGTAVMHGFRRFNDAFEAVHQANMRKVRATSEEQSKRGSKLDVVKPEGWKAPVLTEFL